MEELETARANNHTVIRTKKPVISPYLKQPYKKTICVMCNGQEDYAIEIITLPELLEVSKQITKKGVSLKSAKSVRIPKQDFDTLTGIIEQINSERSERGLHGANAPERT